MTWCGGSVRPRTSTVRPGRTDHASNAVCRLTCSNGASSLVTTDWAAPSGPRKPPTRVETSLRSSRLVAWIQSRKERNWAANSRASASGALSGIPPRLTTRNGNQN